MKLAPISYVTGPLGSGKSYFAHRTAMVNYLSQRKPVLMNYDLKGDWPKSCWEILPKMRRPQGAERWDYMRDVESKAWRYESPADIVGISPPGPTAQEDRGLLVMDEGALQVNARDWRDFDKGMLGFFLNMRKLGWTLLLLTQQKGLIDKQIQEIGSTQIECANLAQNDVPFPPILFWLKWLQPRKAFFIARKYNLQYKGSGGGGPMQTGFESYRIDQRIAQHFESVEVFDEGFSTFTLDPDGIEAQDANIRRQRPAFAVHAQSPAPWHDAPDALSTIGREDDGESAPGAESVGPDDEQLPQAMEMGRKSRPGPPPTGAEMEQWTISGAHRGRSKRLRLPGLRRSVSRNPLNDRRSK